MGNDEGFDLDGAVRRWRSRLTAAPAVTTADLDELEDHVRQATAALAGPEVTRQEAFLVACHRFGAPETLDAEFGRACPDLVWRRRLQWMLAGYVALSFFWLVVRFVASSVPVAGAALGAGSHFILVLGVASVLAGCALFVVTMRGIERGWFGTLSGFGRKSAVLLSIPLLFLLSFGPHLIRQMADIADTTLASGDSVLRFANSILFPLLVICVLAMRLDASRSAAE